MEIFSTGLILYLISAMIEVESGGNDRAFNKKENAVGCLQIRPIYLEDIERFSGKKYEHEDMYDRALAIEATLAYMYHYGRIIHEKEGREVTLQDLARLHNGSYEQYNKPSTEIYWEEVQAEYNKLTEWIDIK
jgi:hypothetical protein